MHGYHLQIVKVTLFAIQYLLYIQLLTNCCLTPTVVLSPVSSARNLGVVFDCNLSLSDHISSIIKSCLFHVRDLRRLRPILDQTTARNNATALIDSKLDYCNSLFLNLPANQLDRLQLVLNSAARAVTNTPKFHHRTPILKSLLWLKITERIHYKILSITYKCLLSDKPAYLRNLLTVQNTSDSMSTSSDASLSQSLFKHFSAKS
jgi:hypothetical protein